MDCCSSYWPLELYVTGKDKKHSVSSYTPFNRLLLGPRNHCILSWRKIKLKINFIILKGYYLIIHIKSNSIQFTIYPLPRYCCVFYIFVFTFCTQNKKKIAYEFLRIENTWDNDNIFLWKSKFKISKENVHAIISFLDIAFFRNWRYEQELASLLWKIDYKDLTIDYADPCTMVTYLLVFQRDYQENRQNPKIVYSKLMQYNSYQGIE